MAFNIPSLGQAIAGAVSPSEPRYLRGAFIGYMPGEFLGGSKIRVPFRFNPESIQRNSSIETGKEADGAEGAKGPKPTAKTGRGADANSGKLKIAFSVKIRFDAFERSDFANALLPDLGISPELA